MTPVPGAGGPSAPAPRPNAVRRRILRGVAVATVLFLGGIMGLIAWFAVQTEAAHEESRCPFDATGRSVELGADSEQADETPIRVVEESRSCVRGIAEHRWRLSTGTEIGRRRLPVAAYDEAAGYGWDARRLDGGALEVSVQPAGETKVFRLTRKTP